MSQFRQLTEMEIAKLAVYGCSAVNWKSIKVAEDFSADFFQNVHFSGDIQLGTYHKLFDLPGGLQERVIFSPLIVLTLSISLILKTEYLLLTVKLPLNTTGLGTPLTDIDCILFNAILPIEYGTLVPVGTFSAISTKLATLFVSAVLAPSLTK
jgi:hypothetical protein